MKDTQCPFLQLANFPLELVRLLLNAENVTKTWFVTLIICIAVACITLIDKVLKQIDSLAAASKDNPLPLCLVAGIGGLGFGLLGWLTWLVYLALCKRIDADRDKEQKELEIKGKELEVLKKRTREEAQLSLEESWKAGELESGK